MLSVQEFAQDWHRLLFAQEMPQVWKQMEEVFRRVVAQVALASHRERGESVDLDRLPQCSGSQGCRCSRRTLCLSEEPLVPTFLAGPI